MSLALGGEADRYVAGLTSWRRGEEDDWYSVFVDALFRSAQSARRFAASVRELQERWLTEAGDPRAASGPRTLIEQLPSQPIVSVKTAAELLGGTEERARQAISRVEQAGVLRELGPPDRTPRSRTDRT